MSYPACVRAAGLALAAALLVGGSAWSQHASRPIRSDIEPIPAEDRSSMGALVLADSPVIAVREVMDERFASARSPTATMGAGPARVTRGVNAREGLRQQRTQDAVEFQRRGAGALTPK